MDNKKSRIILALDNMTKEEVTLLCKSIPNEQLYLKVGLELFLRYGRDFLVEFTETFQKKIFLDLKLHDIPNTVSKAIYSLQGLPIEFLTIHLSGGFEMVKAAQLAKESALPNTKLLGVSYLTSLSQDDFGQMWQIKETNRDSAFLRLFDIAKRVGIDGVVLSPHELPLLEGSTLLKVTPGIRLGDPHDQKRVMTPAMAFAQGADFLVIGREVTLAKDPTKKLTEIYHSL